ncbi:hypothetical protein [Alicyclobacillus vulcanalis]|nr:hypothetical protein [Alicyclobacillus vulcanalis]
MGMSSAPPVHTVAAFYRLLAIEGAVLLGVAMIVYLVMRFWRTHGEGFRQEFGLEPRGASSSGSLYDVDPAQARARTLAVWSLGSLWIVDGLLQAQPALGTQFFTSVIQPVMAGQPKWVNDAFLSVTQLVFTSRPLWFDSLTVWIQILLGVGILAGPRRFIGRLTLRLSIVWSFVVWAFGEGFGQVLSGGSWLMGSPGSVLVYAALAFILLAKGETWRQGRVKHRMQWWMAGWFGASALLQALPSAGYWSAHALSQMEMSMAQIPQPHAMAAPLYAFAHALSHGGPWWNALFVAIPLALALGWFIAPESRTIQVATSVVLLAVWWLGQDFGVIGGTGTDPNTALPLFLMTLVHHLLPRDGSSPWRRLRAPRSTSA